MHRLTRAALSGILFMASSTLLAATGPIILGGDDLDDHGSGDGTTNLAGWLYAEVAVSSLLSQETRAGTITHDIAAIGPADPGAGVYTSFNAGGMVNSVADALGGLSVLWVDSAADVTDLFTNIGNGTVNPRILWIVSNASSNDLDADEEAALALLGPEISSFQQSGGGLMSHVHGYAWLSALLPGIILAADCNATGATLTPEGNAAFPGLTDDNVSAGPCHASFSDNLGGLDVLAEDGDGLFYIIGGSAGISIDDNPAEAIPVLSASGLAILALGFLAFGLFLQRKRLN